MADGDGKLAVTGIIGTDPVPESGDDPSHFTQTDNAPNISSITQISGKSVLAAKIATLEKTGPAFV